MNSSLMTGSARSGRKLATAGLLATTLVLAACGSNGDGGDGSSGGEATYTWNFADYSAPTNVTAEAMVEWAEEVEELTDGRVKINFFYSGALLPAQEILPGVGDGRADLGYIAAQYHPSDLPLSQISGVPFLNDNAQRGALAFGDLYEDNEALRQEWQEQGVHMLTPVFTPPAIVVSKRPVESLEDFRQAKVRTLGYQAEAFKQIGAAPVGIPQPEVYQSLERGVIDMASGTTLDLASSLGFEEVTKHYVGIPTGQYVIAGNIINLELWESLPDDIKDAIETANENYLDNIVTRLEEREAEACEQAKAAGVTISILPEADAEQWESVVGDSILDVWSADAAAAGATDPDAFAEDYRAALADHEDGLEYEDGMEQCAA